MPYQPAFHSFNEFEFSSHEACFTGSYYTRILTERRRYLDMIFAACTQASMPLNVFDRNHNRMSRHFEFRFPSHSHVVMHPSVSHRLTASVYKAYVASVNVNSVSDSSTMYSRRLLEILACGGIAVTNPSAAVTHHFKHYCHVVENADQAVELLGRLRHGPSVEDKERAAAGAAYVRDHHTWAHRLRLMADVVNL